MCKRGGSCEDLRMNRGAFVLAALAALSGVATAQPAGQAEGTPQTKADGGDVSLAALPELAAADSATSPWLDLAPNRVAQLGAKVTPQRSSRLPAALTLGGLYAGFTAWTYFAWYRQHRPLEQYRFGCFFCDGKDGNVKIWSKDGWFGSQRYAGGADKLGHAWANMGLTRAGVEILNQWGGYDRTRSIWVSGALSELLFFGVELKDGAYYEFSFGDLTFNTLGVALGMAMSHWPRLDEFLDFRVEYWPSDAYRSQFSEGNTGKNVNFAEDYSGETYLLAFHLGAIERLRESRYGGWSKYVDVVAGFGARGYKPEPPVGAEPYEERQEMFLGLSLNAQGVFDALLEGRSRGARKFTHGLFEVMNLPFTSLPVLQHEQRPSSPAQSGGA